MKLKPRSSSKKKIVKNQKNRVWKNLNTADIKEIAKNFVHLSAKTTSTLASSDMAVRLENGHKSSIPYIGISILGVNYEQLDYSIGGAAGFSLARQIKAVLSEKEGATKELSEYLNVSKQQCALIDNLAIINIVNKAHDMKSYRLNPLVKQLIVCYENGSKALNQMLVSPLGALGLNNVIIKTLEKMKHECVKNNYPGKTEDDFYDFWKESVSYLGGTKPQNVGLIGMCEARNTKFCLYLPSPKFKNQEISSLYTLLRVGADVGLRYSKVPDLLKMLMLYESVKNSKEYKKIKEQIDFWCQARTKEFYQKVFQQHCDILRSIENETKGHSVLKSYFAKELLNDCVINDGGLLSKHISAVWQCKLKHHEQKNILLMSSDPHDAQSIAKYVIRKWVRQVQIESRNGGPNNFMFNPSSQSIELLENCFLKQYIHCTTSEVTGA